jgi:hypothetical protein
MNIDHALTQIRTIGMDADARVRRNELFQEVYVDYPQKKLSILTSTQLKPHCLQLSKLALEDDKDRNGIKLLRDSTSNLLATLRRKCMSDAFDERLADYVFFPLSIILRKCQKSPGILAELATKCLQVLLEYGWRYTLGVDLGQQLLLLLTFFAGGGPSTDDISEELQIEAYIALKLLFQSLQITPKGSASLVEASAIPTLSHSISVILDGVTDGPTPEAQLAALSALKSVWLCIKDQQALSTFLPGTISALTKSLLPSIKAPRSRKVLIDGLEVLETVLLTSLSDLRTRSFKDDNTELGENGKRPPLTKSWLKATGSQVKLALANVTKLCHHEHLDVRTALSKFCVVVLDECRLSLAESAAMLVETCMNISDEETEIQDISRPMGLRDLATIHPSIAELIKGTIYKWVTSFPRVMQSNDEPKKEKAMLQLSKSYNMLSGLDMDSGVLDEALSESLRSGVMSILELSSTRNTIREISLENGDNTSMMLLGQAATNREFPPVIMPYESQTHTRTALAALIADLGSPEIQTKMASDMLSYLRSSSGTELLSSFWLSFQLLKAASSASKDFDMFLSSAITSSDERESVAEELYSYSLSILSDT